MNDIPTLYRANPPKHYLKLSVTHLYILIERTSKPKIWSIQ